MKIERSIRPISRSATDQPVLARGGGDLLEDHRRGDEPGTDRGAEAQHLIPMRLDPAHVDRAADQRIERIVGAVGVDHEQPAIAQVADARDEPVAERVEHGEGRLGRARGIGRMLVDLDRAFVVDEPVEHIGRLAFGGRDQPGEEGGEPVGEEAVERGAGTLAVFGIIVEAGLAATAGGEELSVGRGHMTVAPDRREGMGLLRIDQHGRRRRVGLGAEMAVDHQHHLVDGDAARALCHALGTGVGRIGKDRGHQRGLVVRGFTGAIMGEAVEKSRPAMHLGKQAGDPDAGHEGIETTAERDDPVALLLADRADGEVPCRPRWRRGSHRRGRLARALSAGHRAWRCVPCAKHRSCPARQAQAPLGAHEVEGRAAAGDNPRSCARRGYPRPRCRRRAAGRADGREPRLPKRGHRDRRSLSGPGVAICGSGRTAAPSRQLAAPIHRPQQLDRREDLIGRAERPEAERREHQPGDGAQ